MNGRKVFNFDIKLSSATISEEWGYNNYLCKFVVIRNAIKMFGLE